MKTKYKDLLLIIPELRAEIASLAAKYSINYDENVVAKIENDSKEDQVSEKNYVIGENKKYRMTGYVEEYEPETIFIQVIRK